MLKVFRNKYFYCVIILLLIVWAGSNWLLKHFVTVGFGEALNCKVEIGFARIGLFPLNAQVSDIRIYSEQEDNDEGIWIKNATIQVDFWRIFKKQINLRSLKLNEANIISGGTDSSFFRLLKVVTADSVKTQDHKWHSFITGGWSVHLVDLYASSYGANNRPHLVLRFNDTTLKYHDVVYTMDDKDVVEDPYKSTATARSFELQSSLFPPLQVGELDIEAIFREGKIEFPKVEISDNLNFSEGHIFAEGHLNLNSPTEFYQLNVKGEITPSHLSLLLGKNLKEEFRPIIPSLGINAEITGQGYSPKIMAKALAGFSSPNSSVPAENCLPQKITFDAKYFEQQFQFENISAEGMDTTGKITLSLFEKLPVLAKISIKLDPKANYYQQCIKKRLDNYQKIQKLLDEIPQANINADLQGYMQPLNGQGSFQLNFPSEVLTVNIRYNGQTIDGVGIQTQNNIENRTASVEFSYNLAQKIFNVIKLDLKNYDLPKILPIITPALSESWANKIFSVLTPQTTIDAIGEFKQSSASSSSGKLEFKVAKLTYQNTTIDRVKGELLLKPDGYSLDKVEINSSCGVGKGTIEGSFAGELKGAFSVDIAKLEQLPLWASTFPSLIGQAKIEAKVTGKYTEPIINLAAKMQTSFVDSPGNLSQSTVNLIIGQGGSDLNAELLNRKAVLKATLLSTPGSQTFTFDGSAQGLPLLLMLPAKWQEGLIKSDLSQEQRHGSVHGAIVYKGDIATPLNGKGEVRISDLILPEGISVVDKQRPLLATLDNGKLKFVRVVFSSRGSDLTLSGELGNKGWDARLAGKWELANILPPVAAVEQINGELIASVDINGATTAPKINGNLQLIKGLLSFRIRDTVVGVREIKSSAVFNDENIKITNLEGMFGSGRINGQGEIRNIFNRDQRNGNLSIKFDNTFLEPIEDLSLTCSGAVAVSKNAQMPALLEGEIKIANLLYRHDIDLSQLVKAVKEFILGSSRRYVDKAVLPTETTLSENAMNLAVKVLAPNSINIDTSYLRAQLNGDINIRGNINNPKVEGFINSINGEFGFQANRFNLLSGEARFTPADFYNDAKLDIIGETQVMAATSERYMVKMIIGGTMLTPIVSFSSNSGMSEKEIVGLLGVDASLKPITILRQITGTSEQSGNGWLTLFSPASVLTVGEKISDLAGFSNISVANSISASTGEQSAKVVAKRSIINKVQLVVQSELSNRDDNKVTVEYSITPFLSFVTGWQSRSEFDQNQKGNGGVVAGFKYRKSFPSFGLLLGRKATKE